jgi:hypothetical protein
VRVIVTGSRDWDCREFAEGVISGLIARHGKENLLIIHGACPTGVDRAFDTAAWGAGVLVKRYPADWNRYGKSAGPKRNANMVHAGADLCLAFHPDLAASKGTADCVRKALRAGIDTWWTANEHARPVRQRLPEGER